MRHEHKVLDSDARFIIDPVTRVIKNESKKKIGLIQGDHNSEVFSFSCPRFIEFHDMSLCDKVEVHFFNYAVQTNNFNSGMYTVDDLQVGEDEDTVVFTWKISGNGTQLPGRLEFLIRFKCTENDVVTYAWNTAFFTEVNIGKGSDADKSFETEYVDIIEQWKSSVLTKFADEISDWKNNTETQITADINKWKTAALKTVDEYINEHSEQWTGNLEAANRKLDFLSAYVTPEMFGAKGNGTTDDTAALQNAFDSAKPVFASKKYLINSPIYINKNHSVVHVAGEIVSNGTGAVIVQASYCKIHISKITGTSDGLVLYREETGEGDLITAYNIITLNSVVVSGTALHLYANGAAGVQYNHIKFGILRAETALLMECGNNSIPWINQNAFYGGRVIGTYGVKTVKGANQTDRFNGNSFNNIGFESISHTAIKLEYATRNVFLNCRMGGEGEFGGVYWVYLTNSNGNLFDSPCMEMKISRIFDDNNINKNFPSYNTFKGYLFLYGTDSYAGRSVIPYNGHYYIEDVLIPVSISSYGKNYDFASNEYLHNDFVMSTGADQGQTIKHKMTEAFGRLIKSFFVNCTYKGSTSTLTFVDCEGNEVISNEAIKSGCKYQVIYTPLGWKTIEL